MEKLFAVEAGKFGRLRQYRCYRYRIAEEICPVDIVYVQGSAEEQRHCDPHPAAWIPSSALKRRDILRPLFPGVDFGRVEDLVQSYYVNILKSDVSEGGYRAAPNRSESKLVLPERADAGLLVWPKLAAAVKCVKNPKKSWGVDQNVAEYVLRTFKEMNPTFKDYTDGSVGPKSQRLHLRTAKMLAKLDKETPGDVHVQPFHTGACFAGDSVQFSRHQMVKVYRGDMPATDFMGFCFALTDPTYFTDEALSMDFPGTERASSANGVFNYAPYLYRNQGRFGRNASSVSGRAHGYGSASVVLRAPMSVD